MGCFRPDVFMVGSLRWELRINNSFKGSVCVVRMPWVSLYDLVSKRS
nr:MAG TPA: hypothetical protein [Caudoviricetes sp.]